VPFERERDSHCFLGGAFLERAQFRSPTGIDSYFYPAWLPKLANQMRANGAQNGSIAALEIQSRLIYEAGEIC